MYLAGMVSSSTTNMRNMGDAMTGTPRLSTSLVASLLAHGVSLPFVLRNAL